MGTFVLSGTTMALLFILHVLLARVLGAHEYGIYAYVMAWINILILVNKLGWDGTIIRYLPAYVANNEWPIARGLLRKGNQIVLIAGAVIVLGLIQYVSLSKDLPSHQTKSFLVGALIIPLTALGLLRSAPLRAFKQVILAQLPEGILKPVFAFVGVLLLYSLGEKAPLASYSAVGIQLTVAVGVFLLTVWFSHKHTPAALKQADSVYRTPEWIRYTFSIFFIGSMHLVLNRTDLVMIGWFRGTTEAGIYAVASRIAGLMTFGLAAVNFVIVPMISEFYSRNMHSELARVLQLGIRGIVLISVPLALLLIVSGKFILTFFGNEFIAGYHALMILSVAQCFNALAGPVDHLMTMTQYQHKAAVVFGASALLNIVLNLLLIPHFGIEGAAIATAAAILFWNITFMILMSRHLNLTPFTFKPRTSHA